MATLGHNSTAEEIMQGVNLTGKIGVITGASSGIGIETAKALAKAGAVTFLAVRDVKKTESTVAEIKQTAPNAKIELLELDLSSLASVRAAAEKFLSLKLPLHFLICNAGVMTPAELTKTVDGHELQFATNHLGHMLLTLLLLPALRLGKPSRVVVLSSIATNRGDVNWEDPMWEKTPYDKWLSYASSKTANALFTVEFSARFAAEGITANAVHPGGIMTGLQKQLGKEEMQAKGWLDKDGKVHEAFKSVSQGAATTLWVATTPTLEGLGGRYCEDCHVAPVSDTAQLAGCKPWTLNPENAKRLWAISEKYLSKYLDARAA